MQHEIYLDNSATTPVAEEVVQAMEPYWSVQFGNPSSPHLRGVAAQKIVSSCRAQLAAILRAQPSELYFTGSGTEANNLALQGVANAPFFLRNPGHIITTPVEHPSVLNVVKHLEKLGWEVTYLPVDRYGKISPEEFLRHLRPNTKIVSVMLVNNELGTINPVRQVGEIIQRESRAPAQDHLPCGCCPGSGAHSVRYQTLRPISAPSRSQNLRPQGHRPALCPQTPAAADHLWRQPGKRAAVGN